MIDFTHWFDESVFISAIMATLLSWLIAMSMGFISIALCKLWEFIDDKPIRLSDKHSNRGYYLFGCIDFNWLFLATFGYSAIVMFLIIFYWIGIAVVSIIALMYILRAIRRKFKRK